MIRAKVSKLVVGTQVLSYGEVKQIEGGEEALRQYDPVFGEE
jgi:hypothetical protein